MRKMFFRIAGLTVIGVSITAACTQLPRLPPMGPNYKPLTGEVAVLAAPQGSASTTPEVYCRVAQGTAHFAGSWKDFKTADFTLPAATRVSVGLAPKGGGQRVAFQAFFDDAGQKMLFCPFMEGPPGQRVSCASIYVMGEDLKDGIKRTFDIPKAVQGGVIACAFAPEKVKL